MQSRQKHWQNNSLCKLWGAKTAHVVGLELFPSISLGTAVTPRRHWKQRLGKLGGGGGVNKLIMGNAEVENLEQSLQLVSNKHTAILLSSGGCSKTCWTSTISSDGRGGRGGGAVASVGRGGRGGGTSWTGAVSVQWTKSDNKYKTQNRRQNKGSCLMLGINHCPVW